MRVKTGQVDAVADSLRSIKHWEEFPPRQSRLVEEKLGTMGYTCPLTKKQWQRAIKGYKRRTQRLKQKLLKTTWVWPCTPLNPAFARQRQADYIEVRP